LGRRTGRLQFGLHLLRSVIGLAAAAAYAAPVVSNVRVSVQLNPKLVDIDYDLSYSGREALAVDLAIFEAGRSYSLPASGLSGVGYGIDVAPGKDKHILWDGSGWKGSLEPAPHLQVKVSEMPAGMSLIPSGPFTMGDTMGDGNASELPPHQVFVTAFYMEQNDVTKTLWDNVRSWAVQHGYAFDHEGSGKGPDHPVHSIDWYDAVKWCDARSEREGLKPCYHTGAANTEVYRSGRLDLSADSVDWQANGYRLPTSAEWEKAARGGFEGHRFPWVNTDTISHSRADYDSSARYRYDVSPTRGYHPAFHEGEPPFTNPVGYFAPNGYGVYDMAGNLSQWCWDWYEAGWYANAAARERDSQGPSAPPQRAVRMMRGGSWEGDANVARTAHRGMDAPEAGGNSYGFRCVRGF
jgi:formylglycine-generating enzyme